jgi:hydroxyacylglutathione hydrolase
MQVTEAVYVLGSGGLGFDLTHPLDCNMYVIDGGQEMAVIDAGAGGDVPGLMSRLNSLGVATDKVRTIFITHAHADHAGGSARLRDALTSNLLASREVATIIRSADERAAGLDVARATGSYDASYLYEAAAVDGELGDGDRIRIGRLEVEVVATPGHSIGHLCFLVHDGSRTDLFSGDSLLFGGRIILQNTWDCDLRAQIESLYRLAEFQFDGFFPGHLTFSAANGRRHLEVALDALRRGAIPPTVE